MNKQKEKLSHLTNQERLEAYNLLLQATTHIWSKGDLQPDKAKEVLDVLIPLTEKDPYFLAHLTSYIIKNSDSKDLRVLTTYANSLSDADGTPFSPGSNYKKPNLRYVSEAAVQKLPPKLAWRVLRVAMIKYAVEGYLKHARHFSRPLRRALKKYVQFRENNPHILKGIKKAGLANKMQWMYRCLHMSPSEEAAAILRWQQQDKDIEFQDVGLSLEGMDDLEIAEKIRDEKLPVLGVLGALSQVDKQVSPVIAVALLEQASGNQAVILRKTFDDAGVLENDEVMELYKKKISEAKTALDRAKTLSKDASEQVKKALSEAKSKKRKEATEGLGKIFLHLDMSGSMEGAVETAKEKGAIIAEAIDNPEENFMWGYFHDSAGLFELPDRFEEDAFKAILYGLQCQGSTDAFGLYPKARKFGADIDVFISDGQHNVGDLAHKIKQYHERNPDVKKPKAMLWIEIDQGYAWHSNTVLKEAYEDNQIPVAVMKPQALDNSALVAQSLREAMRGPIATIEAIMDEPLLELTDWYYSLE